MEAVILVAFILVAALWLFDYMFEGRFTSKAHKFKDKFISFAAGLSVTYIFLHLFPYIYSGAQSLPRLTFLSMLVGFVSYHMAEKLIYKYASREEIMKSLEIEHSLVLFFYHFSIGVVFISIITQDIINGLLYFFPVSLHVIINALPHSYRFRKQSVRAFLTSAPFLGALFAWRVAIPDVVNVALLGMIAGILLFLEAREVIPQKQHARPFYFLGGVILYSVLIIGSWFYVGP